MEFLSAEILLEYIMLIKCHLKQKSVLDIHQT